MNDGIGLKAHLYAIKKQKKKWIEVEIEQNEYAEIENIECK